MTKQEKFLACNGYLWYTRVIGENLYGTLELQRSLQIHGKTEQEKSWLKKLTVVDSIENLMDWPNEWIIQMYG